MNASNFPGLAIPKTLTPAIVPNAKGCKGCGVAIVRPSASSLAKATFCTARCRHDYRIAHNPRRKATCPICGGPKHRRRFPLVESRLTCSSKCGVTFRKLRLRKPKPCLSCGVEFFPGSQRRKFCSLKCWKKSVGERPLFVMASCLKCGTSFRRTAAALKRKKLHFCSRLCSSQFQTGERSAMFRGDKDPNRGAAWNRIADSIRVRDGRCCRRCGLSEGDNGEKLSVDHVTPWRSFEDKAAANAPDNLVSLCRKCHSFKTMRVERRMLKGDRLIWSQWVLSLNLPSVKFGVEMPSRPLPGGMSPRRRHGDDD